MSRTWMNGRNAHARAGLRRFRITRRRAIAATVVVCAGAGLVGTGLVLADRRTGTLVNTAGVGSASPDPNPGNNTASVTTAVAK